MIAPSLHQAEDSEINVLGSIIQHGALIEQAPLSPNDFYGEKHEILSPPGFDDWIIEDLTKSGLTPTDFTVEPLRSEAELKERLGFTLLGTTPIISVGGYWVAYPNVPGYYRLKLKREIIDSEGHKIKYLSPMKEKGFGNHAYIPPEVMKIASTYCPDKPIFIAEGGKKAAKATLEGFPTIGLSGVSCSKDKENDFLPELEELVWKDRTVYISFDSDIAQKYDLKHAEIKLAVKLINRGAKVYSVHLPNEENGNKNGLDDYLVRYRKEAFQELVREAKPTLELHIDGDMRTERLLEEIARIKSESEKNKWVKLISEKRGISQRAINKDLEQYKPKEESEEIHGIFPGTG